MGKPIAVITTGPSSAPIDEVRSITNAATGEIGAILADALDRAGFETALFRGRGATHTAAPQSAVVHEFSTNHDLADALHELAARSADRVAAVFHAAALTDYTLSSVRGPDGPLPHGGKIPGDLPELTLILQPAAKLLPRLRGWFPRALITGWKFEMEGTGEEAMEAAQRQLDQGRTDLTVLNGRAYGPGFCVLRPAGGPVHYADKRQLADFLASRAQEAAKALE